MNSETPQNPASEPNQSPELLDIPENEIKLEVTENNSEEYPDIWSNEPDEIIDVEPDVKVVAEVKADRVAAELETQEEFEPWLDEEIDNLKSDNVVATVEQSQDSSSEQNQSELSVDSWLDEPESVNGVDKSEFELETSNAEMTESESTDTVDNSELELETSNGEFIELEQQKANLNAEIEALQAQKAQIILQQTKEAQETIGRLVEEGMKELKERKSVLQIEIEKLERRRDRINQEMRANFAGASQELAVKVQGFKDYLVGSLQDLAMAAEQLELTRVETPKPPRERSKDREPRRERGREVRRRDENSSPPTPQFTEQAFAEQTRRIRNLIDQYRTRPDYYGSPWQLRRTFEPVHGKKVQEWFFSQGGRGAIDSMGSRLQNILVASAIISILHSLYGDRCKILVLIDTPEKLGEWRRGLQDCLGISRSDFGSNRRVVLFDSAEVLVQRAERLVQDKQLPLIIIDETDELVNLALLKFPLWLAFASGAKPTSSNYLY